MAYLTFEYELHCNIYWLFDIFLKINSQSLNSKTVKVNNTCTVSLQQFDHCVINELCVHCVHTTPAAPTETRERAGDKV